MRNNYLPFLLVLLFLTCPVWGQKKVRTGKQPLFGKALQTYTISSSQLSGATFYLVSGHGGPDPGAIGIYQGRPIHEDEYAYGLNFERGYLDEINPEEFIYINAHGSSHQSVGVLDAFRGYLGAQNTHPVLQISAGKGVNLDMLYDIQPLAYTQIRAYSGRREHRLLISYIFIYGLTNG